MAMETRMNDFWLCFVPLFVAVDAVGVLPMFMGLTEGLTPRQRRRTILLSCLTAVLVALAFLCLGRGVLQLLGITVADFMIAGGILLFVFALSDLLQLQKLQRRVDPEEIGAVPIGVPLITGPAVLTTALLLLNEHGVWPAATAAIVNIGIAGLVFSKADLLERLVGKTGAKIMSKITSLLLSAIAVMMIRKGLFSTIGDL
jgi:multiple antibiotic resistance protein